MSGAGVNAAPICGDVIELEDVYTDMPRTDSETPVQVRPHTRGTPRRQKGPHRKGWSGDDKKTTVIVLRVSAAEKAAYTAAATRANAHLSVCATP